MIRPKMLVGFALLAAFATACSNDSDGDTPPAPDGGMTTDPDGGTPGDPDGGMALDPETAPRFPVDRFSEDAATLFVRTEDNGMPGPNEAIDFDQAPFITQGFGPDGEIVQYYNFDVMPQETAPIYAFFRESDDSPVADQLNVIGVVPGDAGYNDFWYVVRVLVPDEYEANTITNEADLMASGYTLDRTNLVVNCPVVPRGSTATLRHGGGGTSLTLGWYGDEIIYYFDFSEKALTGQSQDDGPPLAPTSPIYVQFNVNPEEGNPASGPASGFVTEEGTAQTHNVVATLPSDSSYSPLWSVAILDNAAFDSVMDLATASEATVLGAGPNVNCPIVDVQ